MKKSLEELLQSRMSEVSRYYEAAGREKEPMEKKYLEQRQRADKLQALLAQHVIESRGTDGPRDHLIIGDAHAHPDYDNERFTALGNYLVATQPAVVISMGDVGDIPSLCRYDEGKRSSHGRTIAEDIAVTRDAFMRIAAPIKAYNRRHAKKPYLPLMLAEDGNHEYRIERAVENDPKLYGTLNIEQLGMTDAGFIRVPFLAPAVVDDICYKHYHPSGVMSRPISGENPARMMIQKGFMSCVGGHTHIFDHSERGRADGSKVFGMVAGCFFSHTLDFAKPAGHMYWRGLIRLRDVKNGYHHGGYEQLPIEDILSKYR